MTLPSDTPLYHADAYLRDAPARVTGYTAEGGILLDAPIFFPTGGGQPGDSGMLRWSDGEVEAAISIATTLRATGLAGGEAQVALVPAEPRALPPRGARVIQHLDWERRHRHMRMHTALHLLSAVIAQPVTGGQIGASRSRLDFDMPDPPTDLAALNAALAGLIDRDLEVSTLWIAEEELQARPDLVRTLSVRPPSGQGRVRLVRIGDEACPVDLQACGGIHVGRTGEIGHVEITRIENKGRQNRRVILGLTQN